MMSGTSTQNGGADQADIQRRESFASADSHTAKEYALYLNFVSELVDRLTSELSFIDSQLQLEADAREILPYVSY